VVIREVDSERVIGTLPATGAAFSRQGDIVCICGTNGFSVWEGPVFERRMDLPSNARLNGPVVISPDGQWVALTQDADHSDHWAVWASRGIEIREGAQYRPHGIWQLSSRPTNTFRHFDFSPDNRFLAASCRDGTVRVLEVWTMRPVRASPPAIRHALRLVWLPGSHTLCTGTLDGRVHLWNLDTDRTDVLTPEAEVVLGLAVSPKGKTLAVGTQDGVLKLFSLPTDREIAVLKGHLTNIPEMSFSPDGRLLISASETMRIWRAFAPGE
jgi:WD40 repeat protein